MSATQTYSYTFSLSRLATMVVIAAVLPSAFAYLAITNESYLIIQGILELDARQATIFYAVFAVALTLVFLLTVKMTADALRGPKEIVLGDHTAIVPRASVTGGMMTIPYASITDHSLVALPSAELMLSIKSSQGRASVLASNFVSEQQFVQFFEELQARLANP